MGSYWFILAGYVSRLDAWEIGLHSNCGQLIVTEGLAVNWAAAHLHISESSIGVWRTMRTWKPPPWVVIECSGRSKSECCGHFLSFPHLCCMIPHSWRFYGNLCPFNSFKLHSFLFKIVEHGFLVQLWDSFIRISIFVRKVSIFLTSKYLAGRVQLWNRQSLWGCDSRKLCT